MRGNQRFKKTAALVLSGVLTLGAVPLSPLVQDAHAEPESTISKVAYATKADLMNKPTTDGSTYEGDVSKVGRIKLGKAGTSGAPVMEWYVLGKDDGVDKDNIAIFAAKDMFTYNDGNTGLKFHADINLIQWGDDGKAGKYGTYKKDRGDDKTDGIANTPTTYVWSNHWGASTLRQNLNACAVSETYFSSAEQKMMQPTAVDTPDYKKNDSNSEYIYAIDPKVYTTEDVLYAAWGDPTQNDNKKIYIGSGDKNISIVVSTQSDKSSYFWLRSPVAHVHSDALDVMLKVKIRSVDSDDAVRPASNLNLSSVIFASAASAATGAAGTITTTDGTDSTKDAMMLRLDGSDKNIGSVSADATSDTVTATKGATTGEVTLIVQGKNVDTDWYYSKKIEGTAPVKVKVKDDIVSALTTAGVKLEDADKAAQIDLTKCRIWLETPVEPSVAAERQTLFYAVKAHTYNEWKSDGEHHWKECIDPDCPNPDEAKKNEEYYGEHKYGEDDDKNAWLYDDGGHYKKCTICESDKSKTQKQDHKLDENGKCTVCNYDIDEKHDWIKVPRQEPTCTEVGYQQYWHCEDGYDVKYYAGSLGILVKFTDMSDIEIPATGHTPAEAWSCNAIYHWQVCEVCDAKLTDTRAKHKFDGGRICTICEYERSYDSDSSDDDDSSSYTADTGTAGSAAADADGSWSRDEQGMRFEYADGSYAKGTVTTAADGTSELQVAWEKVKGSWFAFDADGYAMQDWVYDASDKSWYYCDEDNGSQSGWLYTPVDNCWYYLDPNSGAMHTGWVTIDGRRYYFSEAHNGTYYQDPVTYKWVYANPDQNRPLGSMYVNTVTPDGSFVGADGAYIPQ